MSKNQLLDEGRPTPEQIKAAVAAYSPSIPREGDFQDEAHAFFRAWWLYAGCDYKRFLRLRPSRDDCFDLHVAGYNDHENASTHAIYWLHAWQHVAKEAWLTSDLKKANESCYDAELSRREMLQWENELFDHRSDVALHRRWLDKMDDSSTEEKVTLICVKSRLEASEARLEEHLAKRPKPRDPEALVYTSLSLSSGKSSLEMDVDCYGNKASFLIVEVLPFGHVQRSTIRLDMEQAKKIHTLLGKAIAVTKGDKGVSANSDQQDRQQRIKKFCNDLASIEPIALAAFQGEQRIPSNFREMIDPIVAEFRLLQPFFEEEQDKINEYGYITFRAMSTLHQMIQPMMGLLRDEKPN